MKGIHTNTANERIHNIASYALDGDYKIPSFQRDYVWGKEQVQALLDSIVRGWPLGNMLGVRRSGLLEKLPLKNKFTKSDNPGTFIILDGAQRTETIFKIMVSGELEVFYDVMNDRLVLAEDEDHAVYMDRSPQYVNWSLQNMAYYLHKDSGRKKLLGEIKPRLLTRLVDGTMESEPGEVVKECILHYGAKTEIAIVQRYFELENARPRRPRDLPPKPKGIDPAEWKKRREDHHVRMQNFVDSSREWQANDMPNKLLFAEQQFNRISEKMIEGVKSMNYFYDVYLGTTRLDVLSWSNLDFDISEIVAYFKRINTSGVPVDMDLFERQLVEIIEDDSIEKDHGPFTPEPDEDDYDL